LLFAAKVSKQGNGCELLRHGRLPAVVVVWCKKRYKPAGVSALKFNPYQRLNYAFFEKTIAASRCEDDHSAYAPSHRRNLLQEQPPFLYSIRNCASSLIKCIMQSTHAPASALPQQLDVYLDDVEQTLNLMHDEDLLAEVDELQELLTLGDAVMR
jgi:hypothetical protein